MGGRTESLTSFAALFAVNIVSMPFSRVAILGLGLLGGSLARAVRQAASETQIIGWDSHATTLSDAVAHGVIDSAATDPAAAVRSADLVILCAPISAFDALFIAIGPHLSSNAIVIDVGSTKRSVVASAARLIPNATFVGSHPMAGGERQGLHASRADLFTEGLCLITPTESTDASAIEAVEGFWRSLQMRTQRMAPDEHDALVARASHLPHAVAAALVNVQSDASLSVAAKGFAAVTRPAAGDPALWQGIFLDNRDHLRAAISTLRTDLDTLSQALDANDPEQVSHWLARAAELRNGM